LVDHPLIIQTSIECRSTTSDEIISLIMATFFATTPDK
jgi:hypothetical protein